MNPPFYYLSVGPINQSASGGVVEHVPLPLLELPQPLSTIDV